MNSWLNIRGLRKNFGDVRALDGFDLSVDRGELCVVVGPSGCGKTTLLKSIAGLLRPDDGSIALDGTDIVELQPQRRPVGMVFQTLALYPHLKVNEILAFPLRAQRISSEEQRSRISEVAEFLEISRLLGRYPHELSGGEAQRVAVGRALVKRPKLLLMDEPFSSLDASLAEELRHRLIEWQRSLGITILFVTHDQAEALSIATKLVVMKGGRVMQAGAPKELYENSANLFVAKFLGSPPVNLFEGELEVVNGQAVWNCNDFKLELPAIPKLFGRAVLAVRPESISTRDEPSLASAEIIQVQHRGSELAIMLKTSGRTIWVKKYLSREELGVGERVFLKVRGKGYFFFDPETGELVG